MDKYGNKLEFSNDQSMPNSVLLETVLNITECDFTIVGSWWKDTVALFPYYRLYLVTEGDAILHLKNEDIRLRKGYLYFIPSFQIEGAECDESLGHYWLHFNLDDSVSNYLSIYKPYLEVPADDYDISIFKMIKEKFDLFIGDESDISSVLACESLTKYLFSKFISRSDVNAEALRFVPVLNYMDKNIDKNISNEELSEILHMNPTYFSNTFTKIFDLSPKKYMIRKKMNIACKKLIETDKSIKEIAYSLGYDNEAYFNRLFTKYMDMSPGRYREFLR